MKKIFKLKAILRIAGIIAIVAVIGFSFITCDGDDDSGGGTGGGNTGGGGGNNLSGTITISPTTGVIPGVGLTATYSGSESVSYQWKKGDNDVGTNANKYIPTEAGSYKVIVSATDYNSKVSNAVTVTGWTTVTNSTFGTTRINGIAYGDDKFVAVGNDGKIAYSSDGITWIAVAEENNTFIKNIDAIAYGDGKFVAHDVQGNVSCSSDGGVTWTATAVNVMNNGCTAIAYGNGKFVAFHKSGPGGMTSSDGIEWSSMSGANTIFIKAVIYANEKFVAVGNGGDIITSPDGKTWTVVTNSRFGSSDINGIAYGNGKFVAVGYYKIAYSSDGETWTAVTGSGLTISAIAYGNGKLVAVSYYGEIAYLLVN